MHQELLELGRLGVKGGRQRGWRQQWKDLLFEGVLPNVPNHGKGVVGGWKESFKHQRVGWVKPGKRTVKARR